MLKNFKVRGYGPFLNQEEISFIPRSSIKKEHPNHIKNNLLSVLALYGPNGGGKSSVLHALSEIKGFVLNKNEQPNFGIKDFLNKVEDTQTFEFELVFNINNADFKYIIKLSNDGIEDEKLENDLFLIYERSSEKITLNKELFSLELDTNKISKRVSLLSFLDTFFNVKEIKNVVREFSNIIYLDLEKYSSTSNFKYNLGDPVSLEKNKEIILKILKDVDINIVDFEFVKNPLNPLIYERVLAIKESNFGETFKLDMLHESAGTIRFIFLMNLIIELSNNEYHTLLIDEIDSSLHTKLVEYIVKLFTDSKITKDMQLIFTSHDFGILRKEVFRRDEIYFVGQNESHFSNIVNLFELKIKNEGSYSKQYLEGKFGFDPYVVYSGFIFK